MKLLNMDTEKSLLFSLVLIFSFGMSNKKKRINPASEEKLNDGKATRHSGRTRGTKNYQFNILVDLISDQLPVSMDDWNLLALEYQAKTSEYTVRDGSDIKRTFIVKMCNNFQKPTGSAGPDALTQRSQQIFEFVHFLNF